MAVIRLAGWNLTRHAATKTQAAYARVLLRGWRRVWLPLPHSYSESYNVPLSLDDHGDPKSNKALIERAMKMSANRWRGRIVM